MTKGFLLSLVLLSALPAFAGDYDSLVSASWSCDHLTVGHLIRVKNLSPNADKRGGYGPLHHAAAHGCVDAATILIEAGADVNAKTSESKTPLYEAAWNGRAKTTKLLLEKGADARFVRDGSTLLHAAADASMNEPAETVRLLLDAGLDMDVRDKAELLPACYAARQRDAAALAVLIERGAKLDKLCDHYPILYTAVRALSLESIKILIKHGARPVSYDYLSLAAQGPDEPMAPIVEHLLAHGADPSLSNSYNNTALHWAASSGARKTGTALLAGGADPDKVDSSGETPRSLYSKRHGIDIDTLYPLQTRINRFVQSRLDPWLKKDEYETAGDYAARMKGKKAKVGELMGEAFEHFGLWKNTTVGLYDAESQTFKLTVPEIGDLVMPVPKEKARAFKEGFSSLKFKGDFAGTGKGWTLSKLVVTDGAGNAYAYDSAKQAQYKPVVFDVKTGDSVDTALAGETKVKSEVRKVVVAAADDVGRVPSFPAAARDQDVAVVIGIETYRGLPKSAYSRGDAELVKRYLIAMGFKERNVALLTDERATYIDVKKTLETWLRNVVKPGSRVLVYYSGHGAPDPASGEGYLVPFDGDPEYLGDTAYPLKKLVAGLNGLGAKEAVLVLDSCFSGTGGRSVLAKNARPLVAKTAGPALAGGVAMLSASQSDQISTSSEEFGHGVFTYYFLKALKDGKVELADIYDYARPLVEDEARRQNARQTPTMTPAPGSAKGRFSLR